MAKTKPKRQPRVTKDTTILVRLTKAERASAEKEATRRGWSLSELGNAAIKDFCREWGAA